MASALSTPLKPAATTAAGAAIGDGVVVEGLEGGLHYLSYTARLHRNLCMLLLRLMQVHRRGVHNSFALQPAQRSLRSRR